MIKQKILEGFRNSTYGNKETLGRRVFNNDLVTDVDFESTEEKLQIISSVISEELFNQYSCKIDIYKSDFDVAYTSCTCADFEKHSIKKKGYCCKHLVATFMKFMDMLDSDDGLLNRLGMEDKRENLVVTSGMSILDMLVNKDDRRKSLKFEVILDKVSWSNGITAEFKIGTKDMKSNKLYTLKDINNFLLALYNRIPIEYGKDFTFNIKEQKIESTEHKLINFLKLLRELDYNNNYYKKINDRIISGKKITIPDGFLFEFINIIKHLRVYLGSGFFSRVIETEIIESDIPFELSLKEVGDMMKLEAPRGVPISLSSNNDIFLMGTDIYIPSYEQAEKLIPYIEIFNHGKTIFFSKYEKDRVLRELIPEMQKVTSYVELSKEIQEKIVLSPVSFKFYFNKEDYTTLTIKVIYDKYEFNIFDTLEDIVIYRDTNKESQVLDIVKKLGFEVIKTKFAYVKSEEELFYFFKYDISKLQELGEVFYSDSFVGIKDINRNIQGTIKRGKFDYLEFKLSIKNLPDNEIYKILRAFRDNRKYYRLEDGEFLDLEDIELNNLLKLLDSISPEEINDSIEVPKSKGIYIEDYMEDKEITYFSGREELIGLKNSFEEVKNKKYKVPDAIKAELREYQKYGYNYLKTLDDLGFGGILSDEMGLGKTLQAITFLCSNNDAHSLIIAPTSLIYNWYNEFKKFAPSMKIGIIYGRKDNRKKIIKDYSRYDVVLTTYNTLRLDIDEYTDITFDYCIIDEAQNIKNHNSKNAKAVKSIQAKRRYALTGTPLENSLMELWSIFDFIMPGYLYNEEKFTMRYHRRLEEDECIIEELNRLIKPFILRRYKKDVLKELPPKIEKKLVVPMSEKQKSVYKTYADHVRDILEEKVKDNEFTSSKIEILSYITKLRQIAINPAVVMNEYKGGSGKMDALIDIIKSSIAENHKILVFSQFTSVLKLIMPLLEEENITYNYLDGATKTKDRNKLVDEFNSCNTNVFLISLKAGGTGLNLTSADIVIHLDPWWNPAVEDQATDRAHRIGQRNVVEVIKMVSEGTLEEKILLLQEQKKELINKVLDNGDSYLSLITNLTEEDIIGLFSR